MNNALETPVEIGTPVLEGTDHVELWVGNARQAAYHYRNAFGFDVVAYAGPETGVRDRASYVLQQGKVRLVLTAPLQPDGPIAEHVRLHGDGVRAIALRVEDARAAYEAATSRGARSVGEPTTVTDDDGAITFASVATFGDTVHHFVERNEYTGAHWPGYREERRSGGGVGLRFIDHTVGNVELGKMDDWVTFYSEVFGFNVFQEFDEHDIATQYSALRSKVARDPASMVTFPINEPAVGIKASQIQEYLDYYRGSGVQHIALHTDDIVGTVDAMRRPRRRVPQRAALVLRGSGRPGRGHRRGPRAARGPQRPHRPRRRRLPAADLHAPRRRPAHPLLRGDPAQGLQGLRQGQLQGAVRSHRARTGGARQPLISTG